MQKKVAIIGAGFSSLSAACFLAKKGFEVTVIERHSTVGGRARQYVQDGFTFDRGPSWYWMPDVFDRFFASFGKQRTAYYRLQRLDPSYRIFWEGEKEKFWDISANYESYKAMLEKKEKGAAQQIDSMMKAAKQKYNLAMSIYIFLPGLHIKELFRWQVLKGIFKMSLLQSVRTYVAKRFRNPQIRKLLEFPVLFLGALAKETPALYTMMNYADTKLGTWYPQGGIFRVIASMKELAEELGVQFVMNSSVASIEVNASSYQATEVCCEGGKSIKGDIIVSGADYHYTEQQLLLSDYQNYTESYWQKRAMAPSALLYYVGLNKRVMGLEHHNLFFDASYEQFENELYYQPRLPKEPLFYLNVPSLTDRSLVPEGKESLFLLIPIASGLGTLDEASRENYFQQCIARIEQKTKQKIASSICLKYSFAGEDFQKEYGAFKGNAYGLSNVLRQTANLKPACRNRKVSNIFYTGQLTVPGPGVPPAIISGEIVANEIEKKFG